MIKTKLKHMTVEQARIFVRSSYIQAIILQIAAILISALTIRAMDWMCGRYPPHVSTFGIALCDVVLTVGLVGVFIAGMFAVFTLAGSITYILSQIRLFKTMNNPNLAGTVMSSRDVMIA